MYQRTRPRAWIPRCRRGFTVIELMVTLSVIGLLLALCLPAIQTARESMRRTTCQNHLRQIMLATNHHTSVFRSYPRACEAEHGDRGYSWGVALLPFLDQATISDQLWGRGKYNVQQVYFEQTGRRLPHIETPLDVFRCPSAITPDVVVPVGPRELFPGYEGAAVSNYAGCEYGASRGIMWGTGDVRRRFYPQDVKDGLSNTFAFGERSQPTEGGEVWNTWAICTAGSSGFHAFSRMYTGGDPIHNATLRYAITDQAFSFHPGLCNFAFCDGSVRPLSESIDPRLYQALGGIDDGEIVVLP